MTAPDERAEEREAAETQAMDARRDRAAEAWLIDQHDDDWYVGSASLAEWAEAYLAVDDALDAIAEAEEAT